jgi:hypothetical protein
MKKIEQMNNVFTKLFLIVLACCILSCTKDKPTVDATTTTPFVDLVIPTIIPKGTEKYLAKNSDYVFDQTQVKTYNLIIRNDDLYK